MITQRFKPVMWVGVVAVAATALYTVSLRVANERARLEAIDTKIALTRRDIRQLQTELGTRGSMRQLERWNGEVLSLVSPSAAQFLRSEKDLARVDGSMLSATGYIPSPVLVEAESAAAEPVGDDDIVAAPVRPAKLQIATTGQNPKGRATRLKVLVPKPVVQAQADRAPTKAERVAMLDKTLVSKATLGDLLRSAEKEAKATPAKVRAQQ
jgi:hypothetical protein